MTKKQNLVKAFPFTSIFNYSRLSYFQKKGGPNHFHCPPPPQKKHLCGSTSVWEGEGRAAECIVSIPKTLGRDWHTQFVVSHPCKKALFSNEWTWHICWIRLFWIIIILVFSSFALIACLQQSWHQKNNTKKGIWPQRGKRQTFWK